MLFTTLFLTSALAAVDIPTSNVTEIPAQGTAEGALTTCSDELNSMGRSVSGTPCVDLKQNQQAPIPPAPAGSMQKPGGWMPSDTPGSSP